MRDKDWMSVSLVLPVARIIGTAAAALVAWLFWSRSPSDDAADANWEQRNDLRMPSLENAPQPGNTEVDAAVAAEDMGIG